MLQANLMDLRSLTSAHTNDLHRRSNTTFQKHQWTIKTTRTSYE